MALFISYSSRDADIVADLAAALRRAGHELWIDDELHGGEVWWRAILAQIRDCEMFLAAVSQNMLTSKACQAELRYAQALGKPILPVQVGPLHSVRANPLAGMQLIDFRARSIDSWMELDEAVRAKTAAPPPLPDPLPDEPAMPFGYLMRLGGQIGEPDLSAQQQLLIVAELKAAMEEDGEDEAVRRDICGLLSQLRDRADVTFRTRSEIDALLAPHADAADDRDARPASRTRAKLLAGVAVAVAGVLALVAVLLNSGGEPKAPVAPSDAKPAAVGPEQPASSLDAGSCTAVDAPMADIPTDADEPVLRVPRPAGWESNDWMASDGIFRYAMYNNALMDNGVAASALVALDEERGGTDPKSIFMLKRGALAAIGATDVTVETHTVCGHPAETVQYQTGAVTGLPSHPATLLLVGLQTGDRTYTASLTVESADPGDPVFVRDRQTLLTGFQMLAPARS